MRRRLPGTYSLPMISGVLLLTAWFAAAPGTAFQTGQAPSPDSLLSNSAWAWTAGESTRNAASFQVTAPYCRSVWDGAACTTAATLPQIVMGPLGQNISRTEIVVTNAGPVGRACDLALLFHRGSSQAPEALFNDRAAEGNLIRTTLPAGGARIFTLTPADPAELAVGAVSIFTKSPCSSDSLHVQGRYLLEHESTGEIDEIFPLRVSRLRSGCPMATAES